jgi:HEPN domain-containing protein
MADPFETEAKAWMEKAWRDLEMAQRAVAVMPPFYDMAVYHCQQSGEKAAKAFLVLRGLVFEKTHDIELLIGDASKATRKIGWEPKTKFKDLIDLMVDAVWR